MEIQVILPSILSVIGTGITIASFYRANKKDYKFEQERRIVEAETRTRQHTETSMKLDAILNSHTKLEKEFIGLEMRVSAVENRLIKNETEHESAKARFERLEKS